MPRLLSPSSCTRSQPASPCSKGFNTGDRHMRANHHEFTCSPRGGRKSCTAVLGDGVSAASGRGRRDPEFAPHSASKISSLRNYVGSVLPKHENTVSLHVRAPARAPAAPPRHVASRRSHQLCLSDPYFTVNTGARSRVARHAVNTPCGCGAICAGRHLVIHTDVCVSVCVFADGFI